MRFLPRMTALTTSALILVSLAACTSDPEQAQDATGSSGGEVADQEFSQELHDQLPADIREAGSVVAANPGSFPPYTIVGADNSELDGAVADLSVAMEEILGIEIEHTTVDGLSGLLTGMQAERYDLSLGPIGDFKERQAQAKFIDYVQEFVVFAVPAGNPEGIEDLDSACGLRIAVQAGGSAEEVINEQSDTCTADGSEPIDVQSYKDQPSSILAVESDRADAFFSSQAPLTYFVEQSDGELELAALGESNGFEDLYQGAIVPTDSELDDVILGAMQILYENGTYDEIMDDWGLADNKLDEPGFNLAVS